MKRVTALASLLLLVACGAETSPPAAEQPSRSPATGELLTTRYAVTVLDDGDGAELCLGGVAESLPPQCGGPRLIGWAWGDHAGDFEEAGGVRWGDFAVVGTYDGRDFTPSEVIPGDEFDQPDYDHDNRDFRTPCPEPEGGWPVPDDAGNTSMGTDRAFRRAQQLDDYADSWVDTSRDRRTPEQMDQDAADGRDDASLWIVNVRVTDDPAAAEAAIREVWSGALCVTRAEHTERELRQIMNEVMDLPGMLSAGVSDQQVEFGVIYDDGTLQERLDQTYGVGMVRVESALRPVDG